MGRPRGPTTGATQHMSPKSGSTGALVDARPTARREVQKASVIRGQTARRFQPSSRKEALAGVTVGRVCPIGIPALDMIQAGVKIKSVIINKKMHCNRDDG